MVELVDDKSTVGLEKSDRAGVTFYRSGVFKIFLSFLTNKTFRQAKILDIVKNCDNPWE